MARTLNVSWQVLQYPSRRLCTSVRGPPKTRASHAMGHMLSRCYNTRRMRAMARMLHVATIPRTPWGTCSAGATIPVELCAAGALWHMLKGAIAHHWAPPQRVLQYLPSVHQVCALGARPCAPCLRHAHQPCTGRANHLPHIFPLAERLGLIAMKKP